jgi:alpha-L-rhamnosidase
MRLLKPKQLNNMNLINKHVRAIFFLVVVATAASVAHAVTVGVLRCEYRQDPLGIDVAKPRLSWQLSADR